MAAPVGVELAKQPVLVDRLGDAAKARERACRRDRKGRIDRTRRIIEGYHQVVLTNRGGQPGSRAKREASCTAAWPIARPLFERF